MANHKHPMTDKETTKKLIDAGISYLSFDWSSNGELPELLVFVNRAGMIDSESFMVTSIKSVENMDKLRCEFAEKDWLISYIPR